MEDGGERTNGAQSKRCNILTGYVVEVTGWGAYEAGGLQVGISLVIAGRVASGQPSVQPAHCGIPGWHIGWSPRCRAVQQTPCVRQRKRRWISNNAAPGEKQTRAISARGPASPEVAKLISPHGKATRARARALCANFIFSAESRPISRPGKSPPCRWKI